MGKNGASAFDQILSKFPTDEDRTTFQGLAEKLPELKDSFLMQSDYSRYMNENRDKIQGFDKWEKWRAEEWVPDQNDPNTGWTKRELQAIKEAEELRVEKERLAQVIEFGNLGGDEMNFDELEKWGKTFADKNGFVSQKTVLEEKKAILDEMKGLNQFTAGAAASLAELTLKHYKEFDGEVLDSQALLQAANDKRAPNLKEFYEKDFIVERKEQKRNATHEAEMKALQEKNAQEVAKIKAEADAQVERLKSMGPIGSPTDAGESSMSPMQRQLLGVKDKDESDIPAGPIGGGSAAAAAAARFRETGSV